MLVAVVDVRIVRMGVPDRLVNMLVRVGLVGIWS